MVATLATERVQGGADVGLTTGYGCALSSSSCVVKVGSGEFGFGIVGGANLLWAVESSHSRHRDAVFCTRGTVTGIGKSVRVNLGVM